MAFLNNNSDKFIQYHNVDIFVDKSDIIKFTNKVFNSSKKFYVLLVLEDLVKL